jgi:hypothetical protein
LKALRVRRRLKQRRQGADLPILLPSTKLQHEPEAPTLEELTKHRSIDEIKFVLGQEDFVSNSLSP